MGVLYDAVLGKLRVKDDSDGGGGYDGVSLLPPPKCGDMGNVIGTTTIKLTWSDPDDLIIDGWTCSEWQRTVAVMKVGSYPTSVDDGVIVAATSRTPSGDTFPLPSGVTYGFKSAYQVDSVTVDVEDGDTACIKLFSCSRNGSWNSLVANEYPSYTAYSWGQLGDCADAGTFTQHVPIGSLLDMENEDFPLAKWLVVDEDCFEPENPAIAHHVGLLSYRAFFTAPCDAPEQLWAQTADTAAVTGITYAVKIDGTMTQMTENTEWTAGDTSVTIDGIVYPIAEWYEKNPNASNYISGSNYTPQTNMQNWFESDGAAGQWFTPRNLWDNVNSTLQARVGFQHGLPQAFRSCMLPCKRTAYVYTSYRKRGIGSSVTFTANAFALNNTEVFNTAVGGIAEGKKQLSFLATGDDKKVCYLEDGKTAVSWWLASANTNHAYNVYSVSTAGASSNSIAGNACGYRPACAFGKQANQ